jgi:hypothetical protein
MELLTQDVIDIILLKYLHLNDKDVINKLLVLSDIFTNVKSILLNHNFYIKINNLLYKRYFKEFSNDMFNDIFQKDTNSILINFSINKMVGNILREIYYGIFDIFTQSLQKSYSINNKVVLYYLNLKK